MSVHPAQSWSSKDTRTLVFTAALLAEPDTEAATCIYRGWDKEGAHTLVGIPLGRKTDGTTPLSAEWTQAEMIILRERSRQEEDQCHTTPLTHPLNYDTSDYPHPEQSHGLKTDRQLPEGLGEGWVGAGVSRAALRPEWVNTWFIRENY